MRWALAAAVLLPGLIGAPPTASAALGPCGESQSLPGPGHYSGELKGMLVRGFTGTSAQVALPIGGPLELDVDEAGRVTGLASMVALESPNAGGLPVSATFDLNAPLEGQLPDPVDGADVSGRAAVQAAARSPFGSAADWNGFTNLHLYHFQRNTCGAIQGAWTLEGSNDDEAGRWEVRDTLWTARLVGYDGALDEEVRLAVEQLVALPPGDALGIGPIDGPAEADATIDALVAGAAPLPSGGLFALYERVRTAPAPPAQLRCLADFVQTAIAAKLQEYLAAGGGPTYEDAARLGYGLRIGQGLGSGPTCPAYAAGLGALGQIVEASMNAAMAADDAERVARLTREARLYDLETQAKRGGDWLQQRGYPL